MMINLTKLLITEDIAVKQVAFFKLVFFSLMPISNYFSKWNEASFCFYVFYNIMIRF